MAITIQLPSVHEDPDSPVRSILSSVGDKWTALVISNLGSGTLRFSEIKRRVEGIIQRMLTETLRRVERDDLVTRTVYPTVPPMVEYTLTPLGNDLLVPIQTLVHWALANRTQIATSRSRYDERKEKPKQPARSERPSV